MMWTILVIWAHFDGPAESGKTLHTKPALRRPNAAMPFFWASGTSLGLPNEKQGNNSDLKALIRSRIKQSLPIRRASNGPAQMGFVPAASNQHKREYLYL